MQIGALANKNIMILGGAGYVGSAMAIRYVRAGAKVQIVDRLIYGNRLPAETLSSLPGVSFRVGDMANLAAADFSGVDAVVLLASMVGDPISRKYPEETQRWNFDVSTQVFDMASKAGVPRFVFTSTCSNYGLQPDDRPAREDSPLNPLSLYAESKVAMEKHILGRSSDAPMTATVLRISTAFGLSPRMRFDLTVNEFTRLLALGKELDVYDADTWRPYCHVDDIADAVAHVICAERQLVAGDVFNVGADRNNFTKMMIVEEILKHVNGTVRYVAGGTDRRNYRVNFDKIKDRLGFEPQWGVADFIPQLVGLVRQGLFAEAEDPIDRYGNYVLR